MVQQAQIESMFANDETAYIPVSYPGTVSTFVTTVLGVVTTFTDSAGAAREPFLLTSPRQGIDNYPQIETSTAPPTVATLTVSEPGYYSYSPVIHIFATKVSTVTMGYVSSDVLVKFFSFFRIHRTAVAAQAPNGNSPYTVTATVTSTVTSQGICTPLPTQKLALSVAANEAPNANAQPISPTMSSKNVVAAAMAQQTLASSSPSLESLQIGLIVAFTLVTALLL